ncbi:MAG: acetylglutamate kinase [Ruminococcus sp.]|nr:acetylglutamate kinase [Ruminococcus sp.]
MDISNSERASIIIEALPYIQEYTNKVVVVKYGGNAMLNDELKQAVMGDVILLSLIGVKVVLVHGGGPEISDMLGKIGKESRFADGLRVTDGETMDIVQMILAGKVNKDLVKLIQTKGGNAIGLCGADGGMIKAAPLADKYGYVGEITDIDPDPIIGVLDYNYIPVVSTVAIDDDGNSYNINADTAAAEIAAKLKAECLITLTDIEGILRDKDDPSTIIRTIRTSEAPELIESGVISGGMIPKINGCIKAIKSGVRKVFIIDGRVPHSILVETLTDEGLGTMIIE